MIVRNPITVMRRREIKFPLTYEQKVYFEKEIAAYMQPDVFGKTTLSSLYYDTPDRRLIRASMEQGVFKEKVRLRAYGSVTETSPVFLELKRKYDGIVYKRRIESRLSSMDLSDPTRDLPDQNRQIASEIRRFFKQYEPLSPAYLILYDRTAYVQSDGDLRLTVDENIRYRTEQFDLTLPPEGRRLKGVDAVLEIKTQDAIPLWLCRILSAGGIRKNRFSKYAAAFAAQYEGKEKLPC